MQYERVVFVEAKAQQAFVEFYLLRTLYFWRVSRNDGVLHNFFLNLDNQLAAAYFVGMEHPVEQNSPVVTLVPEAVVLFIASDSLRSLRCEAELFPRAICVFLQRLPGRCKKYRPVIR